MKFVPQTAVVVLGLAFFLLSAPPSAQAIGGDQFVALCSNQANDSDYNFCLGYVFAIGEALHGIPDSKVCLASVAPEVLLDSVLSYIAGIPAPRDGTSGELVVTALEASFPC